MPQKTDIEIAQGTQLRDIREIADAAGVDAKYVELYGNHKAKVDFKLLKDMGGRPDGKLVLVTAITPTSAGEGKTTVTVGLADGLRKIGKRLHQGTPGFVDVVQHGGADKKCCTAQNITAEGRFCIAQAALCAWHGGATLGGNTPSRSPN